MLFEIQGETQLLKHSKSAGEGSPWGMCSFTLGHPYLRSGQEPSAGRGNPRRNSLGAVAVTGAQDATTVEEDGRDFSLTAVRAKHPRFLEAVLEDARVTARYRGERAQFRSRMDTVVQVLRLMLVTDALLGQAAYRLKARMQALGIPVLPWIAHRVAMMTAQISIDETVVVHPGVFISHGQVIVEGFTEIQKGAILSPWATVGVIGNSAAGPTIGPLAFIGNGAMVLGQVKVGMGARVSANAVVLNDVPNKTTVVGQPARAVVEED
jgi:serine O-acetyltransferase